MVVDRSAAEQRRAGCSGAGRFPHSGLQTQSGYTWGWLVHSLFPQPAFRGHDPFAQELPSRSRLVPLGVDRVTLKFANKTAFSANRYLIALGQDRQLVLY